MSGFLGDTMASVLGGGRPGGQPKGGLIGGSEGLSMIGGSTRGRDRAVLRRAFGNSVLDINIKTLIFLKKHDLFFQLHPNISLEDIKNLKFASPVMLASGSHCAGAVTNYWDEKGMQHHYCNHSTASKCGQFRAAMAAGDTFVGRPNLEVNTNWGPVANQVGGIGRNQGYNKRGGVHSRYVNIFLPDRHSGGASYSGNPKYVYDSSDYIRYKKLAAKNKNYNDYTFNGASKQYPYTALAKVRH